MTNDFWNIYGAWLFPLLSGGLSASLASWLYSNMFSRLRFMELDRQEAQHVMKWPTRPVHMGLHHTLLSLGAQFD
ncbi:hypothetical protein HBI56_074880 [Parastagonospora nodorum]|uniref:Uncharacterized protein n=1 Tax=Phaeosphaeria nodorum (strain SN15 / ATCC MYA-4574 / FGSC 10173) TaxID=321614 RepID=A0A7U2I034_PHANO|nr:hypothetical protein HBH56_170110 [Parastagonospora nodorum]QRC94422.1 hypothetical protein JI435_405790 [Parastagonospora nodorum SN15]KAH3928392.1 hypothetical protein HBH54_138660 [Parastagonospora nodorum]KAH3945235.1 hypothetical protein HBH53_144020 [Parastagonospora nodorum]KAH3983620.1 hypothetical protein HBH52_060210 [Parastagonospora nodorum]